jgi:2-isopropylmalate synthase
MRELGYTLDREQVTRAFDLVKALLSKNRVAEEMDLRRIAETVTASSATTSVRSSE